MVYRLWHSFAVPRDPGSKPVGVNNSFTQETSNDIIAGNGSILNLHKYVLIIMFKNINYVHEFFYSFFLLMHYTA